MKRFIAVLLVMGVIMTALVAGTSGQLALSTTAQDAASTTVSLSLSGNYGIVWFSKGAGNSTAISNYDLTMQVPITLVQNTNGNTGTEGSPKVFAQSKDNTTDGLYLNWNIISTVPVDIYLKVTAPMVRTISGDLTVEDKIGWIVKSNDQTLSVSDTGTVTNGAAVVFSKSADKFGNAGTQIIQIETDNVWGKNNGNYTATLTAVIKTSL